MKQIYDLTGKFSLAILSTFISVYIAYFVTEHFFFDKFFYRKSITHGYMNDANVDMTKLGRRAVDIIWLQNEMKGQEQKEIQNDDAYNITIIGDSAVWGQGIKNDERFTVLLEQKLNKVRKTKVYSFALPGDNFTQNYEKIKFLESIQNKNRIDLYILALGHNDAFITVSDRYLSDLSKPLLEECSKNSQLIYDTYVSPTETHNTYKKMTEEALDNLGNSCVIDKIVSLLPKNLIVLEIDNNFPDDSLHDKYEEIFSKYGFRLLTPLPYFKNTWDPFNLQSKTVSKIDGHPSKYVNKIFSKILYEEITKDPKFEFNLIK